jgi:hypothetical protein
MEVECDVATFPTFRRNVSSSSSSVQGSSKRREPVSQRSSVVFRNAKLLDNMSVGLYIDTVTFAWLAACRCGTFRPLHVAFFTVGAMKRAENTHTCGLG